MLGRVARARDHGGAAAVLLERFDRTRQRDQGAVREAADAAGAVAANPLAQRFVGVRPRIAIGGEPLAGRKRIAAAAHDREPAVGAAHREGQPVRRDQDVGLRRPHRPHARDDEQRHAGEPQRRSEQAQHHEAGAAEQQGSDAERRHAADRAGQARDPDRDRDHPVDAEAHRPPGDAVEAERHQDDAEDAHGMVQNDTTGIAIRFAITP